MTEQTKHPVPPGPEAFDGSWAVVLAAGGSKRMGQPKQLLDWEGAPLVLRAVRAAQSVLGNRVLLVTGCCADQVEQAVAASAVRCVKNFRWKEGLGASLSAGVAALPADCQGVLICSCDQPGVTATQLQSLLEQSTAKRVVAARYADTVGIPAWFPRAWFAALAQLAGEQGAKSALMRCADRIEVSIPQARWDVDLPKDMARVARAIGATSP